MSEEYNDEHDASASLTSDRGYIQQLTFAGCTSFMRRPFSRDLTGIDLAVTGIPFDCATTNRPGTRLGPRVIREQSTLQAHDSPYGWPTDPFDVHRIVDYGDCQFDYGQVSETPQIIEQHISGIIKDGTAALSFGGDHYVTYPILKAHAAKYGPLSLLQFDAHTDTWADESVDRIDHGTMFRRAIEDGVVEAQHSVQVGIRTSNPDTMGVNILDAPLVHQSTPAEIAKQIKNIIGDRPCYLTFDIDCLDPAFAPGTGTPVSGGLSSAQAIDILRALSGGLQLKGMDVVEVSPPYDHAGITAIAGAHIAVELIALWSSCRSVGAA